VLRRVNIGRVNNIIFNLDSLCSGFSTHSYTHTHIHRERGPERNSQSGFCCFIHSRCGFYDRQCMRKVTVTKLRESALSREVKGERRKGGDREQLFKVRGWKRKGETKASREKHTHTHTHIHIHASTQQEMKEGWAKSRFWIFNIYNLSNEPRDDLYPHRKLISSWSNWDKGEGHTQRVREREKARKWSFWWRSHNAVWGYVRWGAQNITLKYDTPYPVLTQKKKVFLSYRLSNVNNVKSWRILLFWTTGKIETKV